MPKYRAIREMRITETVEVTAPTIDKAREMIEDDHGDVLIISDHEGEYEIQSRSLVELE